MSAHARSGRLYSIKNLVLKGINQITFKSECRHYLNYEMQARHSKSSIQIIFKMYKCHKFKLSTVWYNSIVFTFLPVKVSILAAELISHLLSSVYTAL